MTPRHMPEALSFEVRPVLLVTTPEIEPNPSIGEWVTDIEAADTLNLELSLRRHKHERALSLFEGRLSVSGKPHLGPQRAIRIPLEVHRAVQHNRSRTVPEAGCFTHDPAVTIAKGVPSGAGHLLHHS